jgi:hypothetical protein
MMQRRHLKLWWSTRGGGSTRHIWSWTAEYYQQLRYVVVNMARTVQMFYRHGRDEHAGICIYGRDAYTFGDTLKETIASLLLKDSPI